VRRLTVPRQEGEGIAAIEDSPARAWTTVSLAAERAGSIRVGKGRDSLEERPGQSADPFGIMNEIDHSGAPYRDGDLLTCGGAGAMRSWA
jgi:hypothetical protein